MKKILAIFGAVAVAVIAAPAFMAFEAHVVNVTAQIENALSVPLESIDFGTVFPQEHLDKELAISLSGSFLAEDRVDDVEYFIRQKPKCGITSEDGRVLDHDSTTTGHVNVDDQGNVTIDCGEAPRALVDGETYGVLPSLCEYISKHPDTDVESDGSLDSFHAPYKVVLNDNGTAGDDADDYYEIEWNDTLGYLAKSVNDLVDNWTIDLAVPCFGGHCAQDWEEFVNRINPEANAADYVQDLEVVNVTATIENALYVHPQSIRFGTVFPQEHLLPDFFIAFSESFSEDTQDRVGTVEYVIKQKPMPRPERIDALGGREAARDWCHTNFPVNVGDINDPYYENCYPSICPYLSKHPDGVPSTGVNANNDMGLPPFHNPEVEFATGKIAKFDANGSTIGRDSSDNWTVDLAVPCFSGQCAQDWPSFVVGLNPNATNTEIYKLPPGLEHEVFGCDLWVEVTDIY